MKLLKDDLAGKTQKQKKSKMEYFYISVQKPALNLYYADISLFLK